MPYIRLLVEEEGAALDFKLMEGKMERVSVLSR